MSTRTVLRVYGTLPIREYVVYFVSAGTGGTTSFGYQYCL